MKEQEDRNYKQRFLKGFKMLCRTRSPYGVWEDLMELFATEFSNTALKPLEGTKQFKEIWENREQEYIRIANKYDKQERKIITQMFTLLIMEYEKNPNQDLLGEIYMLAEINNKNAGQFFTPYNVCELMSNLTFDRKQIGKAVHKQGYASIYDCACGAGATLISAIEKCKEMFKKYNFQNHVMFVGQDIDKTCCNMCYIQLSILGVAGYVINENTLTKPVVTDLSCVRFTPMWFSNVWTMRRLMHNQDILGRGVKHEK